MSVRTRVLVPAALLIALAGLAGCGGSSTGGSAGTGGQATSTTLNPAYDRGQAVAITASGFQPATLVAAMLSPITWTNSTTAPVELVFDNYTDNQGKAVASPPIAPGSTWSFTPDSSASVVYHERSTPTMIGRLQVLPLK